MLYVDDFEDYFQALWGYAPFPWQGRLVRQVHERGSWPQILDLPTGSGKTAAMDIAVFLMALEAGRPPPERRAPRRVVMVIDRRVVVDQGHRRALEIATRLAQAQVGVLAEVAERLRALAGGEEAEPLAAAILRGGMVRDDHWASTPDQPLVAVSTVDQVGSRLLFRGYGLSDRIRPLHAGLLGNDTLLLLDEVHLSQPFSETLTALQRYRSWRERELPDTWQVVRMSATPGATAQAVFGLDPGLQQPAALAWRLKASKPTELIQVKVKGEEDQRRDAFARKVAASARGLLGDRPCVIAVVLNRVDGARRVRDLLADELDPDEVEVVLVTGRMRPLERDDLMATLKGRVMAGRSRESLERSLILVGTQSIEVGADFDFDALVTECASLDALRQRFGRLDRRGELRRTRGVVLIRSDQAKELYDDPIYGGALAATWAWLKGLEAVDFGIEVLDVPVERPDLLAPRPRAPVMLPAHLDQWVQTSPRPHADPDVSLWLHGPRGTAPDVQIVWRSDLSEEDLGEAPLEQLVQRLAARPPGSTEALSVPIYAASAWLASAAADIADVEGAGFSAEELSTRPRLALRWVGDDSERVEVQQRGRRWSIDLHPGDTLVVPSTYGGLRDLVWDPESTQPVDDLGDRVQWVQRGRPVLSLDRARPGWCSPPPAFNEDSDASELDQLMGWLEEQGGQEGWSEEVQRALSRHRPRLVHTEGSEGQRFLVGRRQPRGTEHTTGDSTSSFTARQVSLREHTEGVRELAVAAARALGLGPLVDDVALAASLHDEGKRDPRFQLMLHEADRVSMATASEPLAKSAIPYQDRGRRERARSLAKLPRGQRHELLSVALVQEAPCLERAHDPDLVLHLIASHHGHCRPFAPAVLDLAPVPVLGSQGEVLGTTDHRMARLDSGVSDRFWVLVRRYGWYGLAWLEAVLRLADHRQSERETKGAR